jgi:AcrR family transcriptional regulator
LSASPEFDRIGPRSGATRERLLDAAEHLFAERGFDGTSMRALAQTAGASLSAANYHFGSKEGLVHAALRRRIEPINARRLELLDAAEGDAGNSSPEVEAILEAFMRPVFEARAAAEHSGLLPGRVAVRLYYDPSIASWLRGELLRTVHARFVHALARALPGRARRDLELSYQLTMGMLLHAISGEVDGLGERADGGRAPFEPLLERMVAYGAAGLRATPRTTRVARGGDGAAS